MQVASQHSPLAVLQWTLGLESPDPDDREPNPDMKIDLATTEESTGSGGQMQRDAINSKENAD